MQILDIRRRTGYLFAAVLVGHVVLISIQVDNQRGVPVLEAATVGLFAEVQGAAASVIDAARGSWGEYLGLRNTQRDNVRLTRENGILRVRLQEQRAMAQQTRTLERLLALQAGTPLTTEAAAIIAGAASPDFRTLTINKGTSDGVDVDMGVIAPSGVVGRVIRPSARAAMVQLLTDRNAAAGAIIERTRVQGVVVGTGSGRLRLDYVPATASVEPGDLVVTSGIDGIYPKGFVLGQIESVERLGEDFGMIEISPAVDFRVLESVLVVTDRGAASEVGH
jgi:rod shape-determining protein MreC